MRPYLVIFIAFAALLIAGCIKPPEPPEPVATPAKPPIDDNIIFNLAEISGKTTFDSFTHQTYPEVIISLEVVNLAKDYLAICDVEYYLFLNGQYFGGCKTWFQSDRSVTINAYNYGDVQRQFIQKFSESSTTSVDTESCNSCEGPTVPSGYSGVFTQKILTEDPELQDLVLKALNGEMVDLDWELYGICNVRVGHSCHGFPVHHAKHSNELPEYEESS